MMQSKKITTKKETIMVTLKTATLDGKSIGYSSDTTFYVQTGKDRGAYRVRYTIVGNLGQAVLMFNGINVHNGYKKRLLMGDKTLARELS